MAAHRRGLRGVVLAGLRGVQAGALDPGGPCSCSSSASWPETISPASIPGLAAYVHLLTETAKLALADREAWYGDPPGVGLDALLDHDYLRQRRDPGEAVGRCWSTIASSGTSWWATAWAWSTPPISSTIGPCGGWLVTSRTPSGKARPTRGPRVGQLRIMIPRSRSRLAHRPGRAPSATTPSSSALRGTGGPSGSRQPVDRNNDAREVAILADARELLGRPTLRATYDFFDHGANSMFTLQLVARSRAQHHGPPRQRAEQSHRPWTCRGATAGPVRRPRRARHLVRRPTRAEQPVAREGLVPLGLLTAALA